MNNNKGGHELECPSCTGAFLSVGRCERGRGVGFWVELTCANCSATVARLMTDEQIMTFEEAGDRCQSELAKLADRLERERREHEIADFAHALAVDAVLPEDFGFVRRLA